MASQNDTEPSDFVFETHTNHNVLPPSDDDEHGKPRIAPDILQFIVDQNEVDKQMLVVCFGSYSQWNLSSQSVETLLRRAIVQPNPVDASLPLTDYFISYIDILSPICTHMIINHPSDPHTTPISCRDNLQDTHRQILTPVSLIIMDAVSVRSFLVISFFISFNE